MTDQASDGLSFKPLLERLSSDPKVAEQKWAMLYERLTRFFEWRRSVSAEDLAQETLIRVLRILEFDNRDIPNIPAFALGVARNVLHESWRAQRNVESLESVPKSEIDKIALARFQDSKLDNLNSHEQAIYLREALQTLNQEEFALLRSYLSSDSAELARSLGIPIQHVRVKIMRLRKRIARQLREKKSETR